MSKAVEMADSSNADPLLNLMKMERELFMSGKPHLSQDEKERQWAARALELTSALGSAPTVVSVNKAHAADIPPSSCNLQAHGKWDAHVPPKVAAMARRHSVTLPLPSGRPFHD